MPNYNKQNVLSLIAGICILGMGFLHADTPITKNNAHTRIILATNYAIADPKHLTFIGL